MHKFLLECCRMCLVHDKQSKMHSIFGKWKESEIVQMFKVSFHFEILDDEKVPNICEECLNKLEIVEEVCRNFQETNKKLEDLLNTDMLKTGDNCGIIYKPDAPESDDIKPTIRDIIKLESSDNQSEGEIECEMSKFYTNEDDYSIEEDDGKAKSKKRKKSFRKERRKKEKSTISIPQNKCYICNTIFSSEELFNTHLSLHYDELPYTCTKCDNLRINVAKSLSRHMALHDDQERPYKCGTCEKRFTTKRIRGCHEKYHKKSNKEKITDKSYPANKDRIITSRKPDADDDNKYQCVHCGKKYKTAGILRKHENVHTGAIKYDCKTCGKSFRKTTCLMQHERIHSTEVPYKCEFCGKGFKQSSSLKEHRRIHTGEKPYQCEICQQRFRIKILLTSHKTKCFSPDKLKPSKCRLCSSMYPKHSDLIEHIGSIHSNNTISLQCSYCDIKYKDVAMLADHENNHTNPQPFECKICCKIFTQYSNLVRHQRLHTGEKPFKCEFCGKEFHQAGGLKIHRRTHTGEKPFVCDVCEKAFGDNSSLNTHKKTHSKIPVVKI